MEGESEKDVNGYNQMLPPQPGTFQDREELIKYVRDFGACQGYVVTIKKSRKDRRVILGCDRGGVYRNRRKIDESKRKRKASSRLINCPFEAIGKKEDDLWVLTVKCGEHNHEALKDMSEHPYYRRFTEEEIEKIKLMTKAGVKPRQVLKTLKQSNPELQSTPRHLYNLKAKIRQGTLSEKNLNSWRPNRSLSVNGSTSNTDETSNQNIQPLKVPNFIGGKFVESQGCSFIDVINPATQEIVSQVPLSTYAEFKEAVCSAKQAFTLWKNTSVSTRQQIMFKLHELIHRSIDKLAMSITTEQGKTLKGAQSDVLGGLEVIEQACGIATLQVGEFFSNTSNGIDTYSTREPLGVCAGICPLNAPAMSPLWMFPIAIACGNTFVLKPSEKNPGATMTVAALAKEAGLPDGVLNVVHGAHDLVTYICDDDDIKAISLSGSNATGMHIQAKAASRGKRVQSNVGGKNHAIVMPDASMDATLNALVAAGFDGAGGAVGICIFVGGSMSWEGRLVECAKALKVNVGTDPSADIGPVITKEAKDSICVLVQNSLESGARLLLDGRKVVVPGYENGNFVGPTILCEVTTNMDCYKEEIIGPVLLCMQAENLEEAIIIVNQSRLQHGASIFTASGAAARKFQNEIEAELVGINVPVPLPFSSFNRPNAFLSDNLNFGGKSGVQFYTKIKTVTQQWEDLPSIEAPLALPLPAEKDMTGRVVASTLLSSTYRDSPSQGMSLAMGRASDTDSPSNSVPLSVPLSSESDDLPNQGVSPVSSGADRDLLSHGFHNPPASDRGLSSGEMAVALPPASTDEDLRSQRISERMYMPRTHESFPSASERIHSLSQRNGSTALANQRTDITMALSSKRLYIPTSHELDNVDSLSLRNDSTAGSSTQLDASVHPNSERVYMIATSHLSDSLSHTFQRSDTIFPISERLYIPTTSHQSDRIGSTSRVDDITVHSPSERMYGSTTSQTSVNLASNTASSASDPVLSTSERMYVPPIGQRNTPMPQASERLYIHGTSPRLYPPKGMISMEEYPNQGASHYLPKSQRI